MEDRGNPTSIIRDLHQLGDAEGLKLILDVTRQHRL